MEPKSILEFGRESLENNGNEAIKIIYEHFIDHQRHLNAIVHGEFGFPVNKVVFITRDVRDEMISRLLYFAKPMRNQGLRSEEHTSELQSLMRISYAVFCLKKKTEITKSSDDPKH